MDSARAVLELSAAANIENGEAAAFTANALNAFDLAGRRAADVADILTNAAVKSTGEVSDYALALQQAGQSAHGLEIPVEQTVGMLMQLAEAGIQGSDSGTSLKTMLQRLAPTTEKARDLMRELGVEVFDSDGKFVGIRDAVEEYDKALSPLSDKERETALNILFGSDAKRAANIILLQGVDALDKSTRAASEHGTAHRIAKAQTEGWKGALEGFKSTGETILINLGEKILPQATEGLRDFSGWLSDNEQDIQRWADRAIDGFDKALDVGGDVVGFLGTDFGLGVTGFAVSAGSFALLADGLVSKMDGVKRAAGLLARHPALLVAGTMIGLLGGHFFATANDAEEFNRAIDESEDKLNALVESTSAAIDADLDLASARLNAKEAAEAVREIEKRLADERERTTPNKKLIGELEDQLAQAKNASAKASKGVADAERRAAEASKANADATKASRDRVEELRSELEKLNVNKFAELGTEMEMLGNRGAGGLDTAARSADQLQRKLNPEEIEKHADAFRNDAKEARGAARELDRIADSLDKTKPKLADRIRKEADAARETAAHADMAALLTRKLERIPTSAEVTVSINYQAQFLGFRANANQANEASDVWTGDGLIGAPRLGTWFDTNTSAAVMGGARAITEAQRSEILARMFPMAANPGGLVPGVLDDLGLAQRMGLSLTSGKRAPGRTSSGGWSLHGSGRAIDVAGSSDAMRAFFNAEIGRPGIVELIHSPYAWYPGVGVVGIGGKLLADHWDHVHVGVAGDGIVGTARPTGDGPAMERRRRGFNLGDVEDVRDRKPKRRDGEKDAAYRDRVENWHRRRERLANAIRQAVERRIDPLQRQEEVQTRELDLLRRRLERRGGGLDAADIAKLKAGIDKIINTKQAKIRVYHRGVQEANQHSFPGLAREFRRAAQDEEFAIRTLREDKREMQPDDSTQADLEAQLEQARAQAAVAGRTAELGEAFISALGLDPAAIGFPGAAGGGSGAGFRASARGRAGGGGGTQIVLQSLVPPDARWLRHLAAASAEGFGLQGHRSPTVERLHV